MLQNGRGQLRLQHLHLLAAALGCDQLFPLTSSHSSTLASMKGCFVIALAATVSSLSAGCLIWFACKLHRKSSLAKQRAVYGVCHNGIEELVGNTPIIELQSLSELSGCTILAKLEYMNPAGSSKDRAVLAILDDAERDGAIHSGISTIYEATSGSTGISLATYCNVRGYKCKIFMPEDVAIEKSRLLEALNAEVVRVPSAAINNPAHYLNLARERAAADPHGFFANQFENEANWRIHYQQTGPELWRQLQADNLRLDALVLSSGTGGTIHGVSSYLKEVSHGRCKVFLADPQGSGFYNKVKYGVMYAAESEAEGTRRRSQVDSIVEGVGLNRITTNYQGSVIDDAFKISDQEVVDMSRWLLEKEALFLGSSSALNAVAMLRAAKLLPPGSCILTFFCDGGQRHLTKLWNVDFLHNEGLSVKQHRTKSD